MSDFNQEINIAWLEHRLRTAKPVDLKTIHNTSDASGTFAPLTANLRVVAPARNNMATNPRMTGAAPPSPNSPPSPPAPPPNPLNLTIPDSFNWNDMNDVATKRYPRCPKTALQTSYIMPPPNQGQCGSCWAVSSASIHGDRWCIWTQKPNVMLSSTYVMSCDKVDGNNQCEGGIPAVFGMYCETQGIPTDACWSYNWCDPTATSCDDANMPNCGNMNKKTCPGHDELPGASFSLWKAAPGSTSSMNNAQDIKEEIFLRGPVVGSYFVMADFMYAKQATSTTTNWPQTNGIYMNMNPSPYTDIKDISSASSNCMICPASGGDSCSLPTVKASQCILGGHAVAIVGYGVDAAVPGFTAPVNYWIVRNSWGNKWNVDGFFKVAWSGNYTYKGVATAINTQIALDNTITKIFNSPIQGGIPFGGVTVWDPATTQIEPCATNGPTPPPALRAGSRKFSADGALLDPNAGVSTAGSIFMIFLAIVLASLLVLATGWAISSGVSLASSKPPSCGTSKYIVSK